MLTTLNTIKTRLGIDAFETRHDPILTRVIQLVSGRFEGTCQRQFERATNAIEEFDARETELRVSRFPLESVQEFALKRSEADGWQPIVGVEYLIRRGCVISLADRLGTEKEQMRVTYTGGYVLPGGVAETGQTVLPVDLEQACVEQAAYLFQNRERMGLVSFAGLRSDYEFFFGENANSSGTAPENNVRSFWQFETMDLLPVVKATLDKYKRY